MQQGRPPPKGAGMTQQGMSMPPNMPSSPMHASPTTMSAPGGDPRMMQPPTLRRGYSGGSLAPFPYSGTPMPAAPSPASQQQQRLLQMQIQQQQQQLMQLQQHQQQAVNMAASNDPSPKNQFQQIMPQAQQSPQPSASPVSLKASSDLTSPSDLMRLQSMPQQQGSQQMFQRSTSMSAHGSSGSLSSLPQPPLYQRSTSTASSPATGTKITAATQKQHTPEMFQLLLNNCNVVDKTIYVAKTMLGGNSVNGFLKGTAAAQRIKKQRARQVAAGQKKENPQVVAALKEKKRVTPEQQQEEELKAEAMNARTAKRIKAELVGAMEFCSKLHGIVSSVLGELDPHEPKPAPLGWNADAVPVVQKTPIPAPQPLMDKTSSDGLARNPSQGDPAGSTLRKLRKRKSAIQNPSGIDVQTLEHDETGRRVTKKEHARRIFEVLRFRSLKQGDYVAARVSSRDLWISAIVVQDYKALEMSDEEFLVLTEAKRNSLFRETVSIKDADERDGGNVTQVPRNLVLPLPRNYTESTDWCSRIKKGARVYAMYPKTTSLYSATVIDSTTFCRGEDDIIVVEFDGDEADLLTGTLPQRHIPARFVTAIPKEFPASQTTKRKRASSTLLPTKKSSGSSRKSTKNTSKHKRASSDDALNDMLSEMSQSNFPADGDLGHFEHLEMGSFGGAAQTAIMPQNQVLHRK